MSISSEITRIKGCIANAYTAIENKGGIIPNAQTSENLAEAINSITGGGGSNIHLSNLAINTPPTTTYYSNGQTFNPSGTTLDCTYSNQAYKTISSGYTYIPNGPLTSDVTYITYLYTDGGSTCTTTYPIEVSAPTWEGWSNATWNDVIALTARKRNGEITTWPTDVVTGVKKRLDFDTTQVFYTDKNGNSVYLPEFVYAELVRVDSDKLVWLMPNGPTALPYSYPNGIQPLTTTINNCLAGGEMDVCCANLYNAMPEWKTNILDKTIATPTWSDISYSTEDRTVSHDTTITRKVWIPTEYEIFGSTQVSQQIDANGPFSIQKLPRAYPTNVYANGEYVYPVEVSLWTGEVSSNYPPYSSTLYYSSGIYTIYNKNANGTTSDSRHTQQVGLPAPERTGSKATHLIFGFEL